MAKQVQFRGGTTAETATLTGAVREITVDTDKQVVVVHDGVTAGGFPLQREISKLTQTQIDALTPAEGDEVYNLTIHRKQYYDGITWQTL